MKKLKQHIFNRLNGIASTYQKNTFGKTEIPYIIYKLRSYNDVGGAYAGYLDIYVFAKSEDSADEIVGKVIKEFNRTKYYGEDVFCTSHLLSYQTDDNEGQLVFELSFREG